MAHHLLVVAVSDLVDNAFDAVLPEGGDFTIKGKLKSALVDNAIYYGSYLFICGVLLIYLALQPGISLDWQKLKAIASSASNTWGLFLLVLLLGYALVEVPRGLWNNSKPGFTLQYAYFKLSKLSSEKAEAEEHMDDVLESLQTASRAIPTRHELRPALETIIRKVMFVCFTDSVKTFFVKH